MPSPFPVVLPASSTSHRFLRVEERNVGISFLFFLFLCLSVCRSFENNEFEGDLDAELRPTSTDPMQVPIGPITRARAKKFKEALNGLVQELMAEKHTSEPIEGHSCELQNHVNLIQAQ